MNISGYSKIWGLDHAETRKMEGPLIAEEKIDGSQISWGILEDELKIKSKNVGIDPYAPPPLFLKSVQHIIFLFNSHLLRPGYIYRGESMKDKKHNALEYARAPRNNIILFDVEPYRGSFLEYDELIDIAENELLLEVVPAIGEFGTLDEATPEVLDKLLQKESFLGGQLIEGVVLKPSLNECLVYGRDGKIIMAKYVSEKFKEVNDKNWKEQRPSSKDFVYELAESVTTNARFEKAVQHLRESGNYKGAVQDIGPLMKRIEEDILEECEEMIKAKLWARYKDPILRYAVGRIPKWYKVKLGIDAE